jgi:hypothetical protein
MPITITPAQQMEELQAERNVLPEGAGGRRWKAELLGVDSGEPFPPRSLLHVLCGIAAYSQQRAYKTYAAKGKAKAARRPPTRLGQQSRGEA